MLPTNSDRPQQYQDGNTTILSICPFIVPLLILLFISSTAVASINETEQQKMLNMLDMLDQLEQLDEIEKMELDESLNQAELCVLARNFNCAERQLAIAKTYIVTDNDQRLFELGQHNLLAERLTQRLEEEELARLQKEEEEELARLEEEEELARLEEMEREEDEERRYARQIRHNNSSSNSGIDMMNYMMQASADMRQQLAQVDRNTNAAIHQTNEILAQQKRQRQNEERRQQRADEQRLNQQERQRRAKEFEQKKQRRLADLERQRQKRQEELERQQVARQARLAQQQREREQREALKRQKEQEKVAREQKFYSDMKNGARLYARKCYGQTVVTGSLPSKSGYNIYSTYVDVHFRASCPGGHPTETGVMTNMQDMGTGCFGDTVKISLTCKPESISVIVTDATNGK